MWEHEIEKKCPLNVGIDEEPTRKMVSIVTDDKDIYFGDDQSVPTF